MECRDAKFYFWGGIVALVTLLLEALLGRAQKKNIISTGSILGVISLFFLFMLAMIQSKFQKSTEGEK